MYIEQKGGDIVGPGRIGRVHFSKTGKTLKYGPLEFQSLTGRGYKANYYEVESGEWYWISGCRKDGNDALYSDIIEIDDGVAKEYWRDIRGIPENSHQRSFRSPGKHTVRSDYRSRKLSPSKP